MESSRWSEDIHSWVKFPWTKTLTRPGILDKTSVEPRIFDKSLLLMLVQYFSVFWEDITNPQWASKRASFIVNHQPQALPPYYHWPLTDRIQQVNSIGTLTIKGFCKESWRYLNRQPELNHCLNLQKAQVNLFLHHKHLLNCLNDICWTHLQYAQRPFFKMFRRLLWMHLLGIL